MTNTLAPVECTNWVLSAWNSTLDRNDVPSAWLYGQDHLWATSHLVSSPGEVFPPPSPPPPLFPPTHPLVTKAGATGTASTAMAAPVFISKFLKWLN